MSAVHPSAKVIGTDNRKGPDSLGGPTLPGELRVPWVSHLGPRLGSLERSSPLVALFQATVDPLTVAATFYLLAYLREGQVTGMMFTVGVLAFLLAGYILDGSLLFLRAKRIWEDLSMFAVSWLVLLVALLGIGYISGYGELIDAELFGWWALITPLALVAMHACVYVVIRRSIGVEEGSRATIIVGATQAGRALAAVMHRQPLLRLDLLGFFDDRVPSRSGVDQSEVLGRIDDVANYVSKHGVHSIYITLPMTSQPRIVALLNALRDTTASIYFVPDMFTFDLIQARFDHVGGIPVMSVCDSPFEGLDGVAKRLSDIVLATLILCLIWPLMLLIAIAVKLSSPGPAVFRQRRYGLDGKDITVYKFRTMTVMEDGKNVRQAVRGDQRLTRIGGFLRRSSLDELPQFINVVQGRMSIVGPRPHANAHNEQYRKLINGYMVRHKVRPGITGWAQVKYPYGSTVEDALEKLQYDLYYIKRTSIFLDLVILLRSIQVVLFGRGAR